MDLPGLEPGTFGLQSRRSTTELQALSSFRLLSPKFVPLNFIFPFYVFTEPPFLILEIVLSFLNVLVYPRTNEKSSNLNFSDPFRARFSFLHLLHLIQSGYFYNLTETRREHPRLQLKGVKRVILLAKEGEGRI